MKVLSVDKSVYGFKLVCPLCGALLEVSTNDIHITCGKEPFYVICGNCHIKISSEYFPPHHEWYNLNEH